MKTTLIMVGIVVVGIIALLSMDKSGGTDISFEAGVIHPQDHIKGNASSTVVLMEYADFQCPACRSYYPVLRELFQEYGKDVAFVYRSFPLISIHQNAEFAARAAEAASLQGKFWEMHDLLFEKQNEWATVADVGPVFASYAELLGLNVAQFKTDWVSTQVKNFVKEQRLHANKIGLQGTPTFFLNGVKIENPNSLDQFKQLLRTTIADSKKTTQ